MTRLSVLAALAFLSVAPVHAVGTAESYAPARKAFQEAYARVTADVSDPAVDDSAELRAYPLYPYLESARIQQALRTVEGAPGEIDKKAQAFLSAYALTPVSRGVRRAWLDSLSKRTQWATYLEGYRDVEASEAQRCLSFVARIELKRVDGLAADIAKQWLTPRSLPDCERPFAWMKDNSLLTTELIEQRSRLALMENNATFARQIIDQLPADRAAPLLQWAALIDKPAATIDALIATPESSIEPQVLLAGWTRLARTDRQAASQRFENLKRARGFDDTTASPYALILAFALSWDRDSAALDYFDLVAPADLNDNAYEWWARSALLAGKWELTSKIIERMSETLRQNARWRYWAARAASAQHEPAKAKKLYESLLPDDNYYSAMAAARLKKTVVPHPQPLARDVKLLTTVEGVPALERARELFLCGLRPEALSEWRLGFENLPEGGRQQAIHLAAQWGWYDQAIAVASTQSVFFDYELLYPRPYDNEVDDAAGKVKLSPDLVYGIVRQESLFRPDALSSANARGLMQLTLDTARRTARKFGHPVPSPDDLFNPSINVPLGAAHFRELMDRFDGQVPVALAGYNAGPNAASRWLPSKPLDSDIWIENIPYNETRGYVQRILWHQLTFAWLRHDRAPQHTGSWLKPVRPVR